jgi:hypothetical protein
MGRGRGLGRRGGRRVRARRAPGLVDHACPLDLTFGRGRAHPHRGRGRGSVLDDPVVGPRALRLRARGLHGQLRQHGGPLVQARRRGGVATRARLRRARPGLARLGPGDPRRAHSGAVRWTRLERWWPRFCCSGGCRGRERRPRFFDRASARGGPSAGPAALLHPFAIEAPARRGEPVAPPFSG